MSRCGAPQAQRDRCLRMRAPRSPSAPGAAQPAASCALEPYSQLTWSCHCSSSVAGKCQLRQALLPPFICYPLSLDPVYILPGCPSLQQLCKCVGLPRLRRVATRPGRPPTGRRRQSRRRTATGSRRVGGTASPARGRCVATPSAWAAGTRQTAGVLACAAFTVAAVHNCHSRSMHGLRTLHVFCLLSAAVECLIGM